MKKTIVAILLACCAAVQAQPTVQSFTSWGSASAGTSHTVTVPSWSIGDKGVIFVNVGNSTIGAAPAITGWTRFFTNSPGSDDWAAFYRDFAAADSSGTVSISRSNSGNLAALIFRITGAETGDPSQATPVYNASGTAGTAPAISVASGNWLYIFAMELTASRTVTDSGTGTLVSAASTSGSSDMYMHGEYIGIASSTGYTPAAFGFSPGNAHALQTIAIEAVAAGVADVRMMQNIGAGFGPHESQQLGGLLQ